MSHYESATVNSLAGLQDYGFNVLTGEACAYSMRLLVDLSEKGIENYCKFYGLKGVTTHPNWNSHVGNEDAVGSVMMTADDLWELAAFLLLEYGWDRVIPNQPGHHGVYAFDMSSPNADEFERAQRETLRVIRNPHKCSNRNYHQMSGRVV